MLNVEELATVVEVLGKRVAEGDRKSLAVIVAGFDEDAATGMDHTFGFVIGKRSLLVRAIINIFNRHPELLQDVIMALSESAKAEREAREANTEASFPDEEPGEVGGAK